MIEPFEFFGVGRIVFGRGKISTVGQIAATLGQSPMLIHNGGAEKFLLPYLEEAKLNVVARQKGEPVVADVDAAVAEAREMKCDCLIAIGGGSAIDVAKAAAGILTNGGSAIDYMEIVGNGKKITKPATPWMAIPTTAGSGAEATRNAVIGLPEKQFKASIRSELLLPRVILIDPEIGRGVPPDVTASSGMDALCQLIEAYTSTGASPMTDALAMRGIRLVRNSLVNAFKNGEDLDARESMSLAALLSGIALTSAGLGAVHGFAAPLGATLPIPHGTICAALLPRVIAANVKAARRDNADAAKRCLDRYSMIGHALLGEPVKRIFHSIDELILFTHDLLRQLNIPPLGKFGLKHSDIPAMVALARKTSSMRYNPIALSDEDLSAALAAAIDG